MQKPDLDFVAGELLKQLKFQWRFEKPSQQLWKMWGLGSARLGHVVSDYVLRMVIQSCPTLATPWTVAFQAPLSMRILQARIVEWVAMHSSRRSSQPRDQTQVSCTAGKFFMF